MPEPSHAPELSESLALAFAPLHKRAFGMAIGLSLGLVVFAVTAITLVRPPHPDIDLALLA